MYIKLFPSTNMQIEGANMATTATLSPFLLIICLLVVGSVDSQSVRALAFDNFLSTIQSESNVLVKFYAPWCGHCVRMQPEYERAATKLGEEHIDVVLAKVDATQEEILAGYFQVTGFPTLKFFQNGASPIDYSGGRSSGEIINWVKSAVSAGLRRPIDGKDLPKEQVDETVVDSTIAKEDTSGSSAHTAADDADDSLPPVLSFPPRTLMRLLTGDIHIKGDSKLVVLIWDGDSAESPLLSARFDALATAHTGSSLFIGVDSGDVGALDHFAVQRSDLPAVRAVSFEGGERRFVLPVDGMEGAVSRWLMVGCGLWAVGCVLCAVCCVLCAVSCEL
jgi:protein disulfide-isomerase-like protein